ncbi:hypothetical protein [Haliangium sp.]|uniref:hypothetical protein n=1 Tax=Haliangium sp. TaxID=2663208 RepID=UPI003D101E63
MVVTAQWLSPEAWLEVCGDPGLRQPYRPRGSEDELARVLAHDPRRVAAVIAPPGAGASRLCLELARAAPVARYPDARVQLDAERAVAELTEAFLALPDTARPVVVLDGPSPDPALAALEVLASRRIHPRLLVLVPTDPDGAARLPVLSRLARASLIAVTLTAAVDGPAAPVTPAPDELLPFVLGERAPAGRFESEPALRAQGWLIDADGGVLARIGDRARRALVERLLLGAEHGAQTLARILDAAPELRAGALSSILRWSDGEPGDDLLAVLLAGDEPALVDADALARRAIPASSRVLSRLAARAEQLMSSATDDERAASLFEIVARDAARRGQPAIDLLRSALERTRAPERRARLLAAIAWITNQERGWQDALEAAAAAGGDAQVEVLARRAHGLELDDRPSEAMACVHTWLLAEEARGCAAGAARARMRLAALARATGAVEDALEHLRHAREQFRAVGDVRGELSAEHMAATLLLDAARFDDGAQRAREALSIAETIGDAASIGWARYVLGARADRGADPATARDHYEAAIAAWTESGHPIPDRLRAALAAARAAAVAPAAPMPEDDGGGIDGPAPGPEDDNGLVTIAPRRRR